MKFSDTINKIYNEPSILLQQYHEFDICTTYRDSIITVAKMNLLLINKITSFYVTKINVHQPIKRVHVRINTAQTERLWDCYEIIWTCGSKNARFYLRRSSQRCRLRRCGASIFYIIKCRCLIRYSFTYGNGTAHKFPRVPNCGGHNAPHCRGTRERTTFETFVL